MPDNIPAHRIQITDDLNQLLAILPTSIRQIIDRHDQRDNLIEVVMDLGRLPEARFPDQAFDLGETSISQADLEHCVAHIGQFSSDNRAGIERTLHRISAMRNRAGEIVGLTCRVGRAVFGTIVMIRDLIETGQSLLLLGRPGVGKTTALREIARVLADDLNKRVVIIDTSNEIAGDGDIPHPAIGRARRMQVARPELQHQVMIEAVENHMPEVIVIDEIGTELEALAARTIAERGVQLVGTAHGNCLENLIKNPTLADLVGGIQAVTLGDEEARRRRSQKTVLERKAPPTFVIAVEMLERQRWIIHEDTAQTVDHLLRGHEPQPQIRTVSDAGEVQIEPSPQPTMATTAHSSRSVRPLSSVPPAGLRASGKMTPVTPIRPDLGSDHQHFEQMLAQSWSQAETNHHWQRSPDLGSNEVPIRVYLYGVERTQIERAIAVLNLPVILTQELNDAEAILALRSRIKNHSKLRQSAKAQQLPIYAIKSSTIPQIIRGLRRLLNLDDLDDAPTNDLRLYARNGNDDEIEALEEARLAVEQIVIPKGQPVELLPRSAKVRRMQHELVEHYRLQSSSCGEEPNRRLKIFPA